MERIHHPELELQRHQHAVFCDKINEADILLSGSDQTRFLDDLLKYLITWLYRHIIGCDLMIGKMPPADTGKKVPVFTNEYLTGIGLIDDEHKELFRIIGEVHRIIHDEFIADKYDEIVYLLEELKNYTKFHFADEEKYMQSIQYEGLAAQQRAHDAFVARLEEMDFQQIEGHQQETLEEILEFLTDWLINHILNSDKKSERRYHDKTSSISSFIFVKPNFSYKGRPMSVASREIDVISLILYPLPTVPASYTQSLFFYNRDVCTCS